MPHSKKNKDADDAIPNYSKYDNAETLPQFAELDRLLESELNTLECYREYQLEAPLNSFNDNCLNAHLYMIFHKQKSEGVVFSQKLVSFFVHQHHTTL